MQAVYENLAICKHNLVNRKFLMRSLMIQLTGVTFHWRKPVVLLTKHIRARQLNFDSVIRNGDYFSFCSRGKHLAIRIWCTRIAC